MVTNLVYVLWASGEVQPFNTPHLLNKEESADENDTREDSKSITSKKQIEYVKT